MKNKSQIGSSLVEVMVALFVLAIGLLGILAMQAKSMQYNQSAHVYSQAVYLANDIAERIRGNFGRATAYTADAVANPKSCTTAACTLDELVQWDRAEWEANIEDFLPAGQGNIEQVDFDGRDFLSIQVSFDDSRAETDAPSAANNFGRRAYVLMVEI